MVAGSDFVSWTHNWSETANTHSSCLFAAQKLWFCAVELSKATRYRQSTSASMAKNTDQWSTCRQKDMNIILMCVLFSKRVSACVFMWHFIPIHPLKIIPCAMPGSWQLLKNKKMLTQPNDGYLRRHFSSAKKSKISMEFGIFGGPETKTKLWEFKIALFDLENINQTVQLPNSRSLTAICGFGLAAEQL